MKKYIKPTVEFIVVSLEDIILLSFVNDGHNIFDFDDEV